MTDKETVQQRIVRPSASLWRSILAETDDGQHDGCETDEPAECSLYGLIFEALSEHFASASSGAPASGVDVILHCHMGELWASEQEFGEMDDTLIVELANEDIGELIDGATWTIVRPSRESATE